VRGPGWDSRPAEPFEPDPDHAGEGTGVRRV